MFLRSVESAHADEASYNEEINCAIYDFNATGKVVLNCRFVISTATDETLIEHGWQGLSNSIRLNPCLIRSSSRRLALLQSASPASTPEAAAIVRSMSSSECAAETKLASNWLQGR